MRKTIFLFPGQGSQKKIMVSSLYDKFSIIRNMIKYVSKLFGYNLLNILKNSSKLNDTINAQPLVLIVSVAFWRLWNQKNGYKPVLLVGHSLGEYTALVCSNSLSLKNMIILILKRAKIMRDVSKKNNLSMMSILNIHSINMEKVFLKIKKRCYLEISNINSKKQIVISIKKSNIFIISKILNFYEIKYIVLQINVASHCNIMYCISRLFRNVLNFINYKKLTYALLHNLNMNYCKNFLDINKILVRHIYKNIVWMDIMKYIEYIGIKYVIECGYGDILKKLTNRMTKISCENINNYGKFKKNTI